MHSDSAIYCRPGVLQRFRSAVVEVDSTEGLFRAAFAIALHERPEASLADAEETIASLARLVSERARTRSVPALLAHLHDVLFEVYGLRGNRDDYYRPANSYLPDVLQSRLGIPITLTLVYKSVAEQVGLVVHGVNVPGHFLAEVEGGELGEGKSMIVDPFYGGGVLSVDEVAVRITQATGRETYPGAKLLARATHRQWLARILNNLQASFAVLGQDREVCAMQEMQGLL
jgi:regulator of sirC expression with transglutaminase-like and TPR domain